MVKIPAMALLAEGCSPSDVQQRLQLEPPQYQQKDRPCFPQASLYGQPLPRLGPRREAAVRSSGVGEWGSMAGVSALDGGAAGGPACPAALSLFPAEATAQRGCWAGLVVPEKSCLQSSPGEPGSSSHPWYLGMISCSTRQL